MHGTHGAILPEYENRLCSLPWRSNVLCFEKAYALPSMIKSVRAIMAILSMALRQSILYKVSEAVEIPLLLVWGQGL